LQPDPGWRSARLVLTRKPSAKVVIGNGNGITLTVVEVRGKRERVGIEAPGQVCILRGELSCRQGEPAGCDGLADPASPCGEEDGRPPP
jgi:carbon storage regulator CsrA